MGQIVKVYKDGIGYQVLNTDNIGAALEAGDNISIDGNEISAVDTKYTAGTGLSLSGTTFSLNVDYGADLSLSIDPSTFVLTAQLKNQNGGNIGSPQTIDLPLESVVVSGRYNSQTKEVELTLQSGSVIRFSVADLVSGLQEELVVGNGINIDANNEISVDTSVIATKEYVDDSIAESVSSGTTAPSNPTEGQLWYDTTNDVLKVYDGTNWNEVGSDAADINTKTFYLSSVQDLTTAQAAYDWRVAGKNPIIIYSNGTYTVASYNADATLRFVYYNTSIDYGSYTILRGGQLILDITNSEVTNITNSADQVQVLKTDVNYGTPYTPLYDGSPATKKYVDDAVSQAGGGDMLASVYDPNNVGADAFDYTNFINTPTAGTGIDITNNVISADTTTIATKSDLTSKQDKMSAGKNISVDGTTINAKDTEYTAGDNITITCPTESDMRGPSPSGFHIPDNSEFRGIYGVLTNTLGLAADGTTLRDYLKMPYAGYRSYLNGGRVVGDYEGYYGTSQVFGSSGPYYFMFRNGYVRPDRMGGYFKDGYNIRCFKNTPVVPDNTWTTLYDGSSVATGAGVFHNATLGLISVSGDGTTWTTIMDKNLGATTVYNNGDTKSEANCGGFFQFGNNYMFPYSGDITVTSTQVDSTGYGPGNYYYSSNFIICSENDWSSVSNNNRRGYVTHGTFQDCEHPIIEASGGVTYTAGTGISIDANNVITNILPGTISSSTAPSNPSEGDLWYDTTNDILKVYNGTSWNIVGDDSANINTKTFTLTGTTGESNLETAQAAYNWYAAGKTPLLKFNYDSGGNFYIPTMFSSTGLNFVKPTLETSYQSGGRSYIDKGGVTLVVNVGGQVTSIDVRPTGGGRTIGRYLDTEVNYSTPYTPQYDGSPATKKYVDDSVASSKSSGATAPSNPTEGQLWYDTTNDILKVYDGTNWNEVGAGTTYTAGTGINITNDVISADTTTLATKTDLNEKQDKLAAGDNVTIEDICITESDMQGPAPSGFHIPLQTEWVNLSGVLTTTFSLANNGVTLGTYLKMPMAGMRNYQYSTNVGSVGTAGRYWFSNAYGSASNTNSGNLMFSASSSDARNPGFRAYGYSIRCLKNTPVIPDSSWTTLYDGSAVATNAGIFWNATDGLISISGDGTTWYTIMDKNLGATTVYNYGDTESDANCGYFYQWGNNYGFPHSGNVTASHTQIDSTGYGPGNYYSSSTYIGYDGDRGSDNWSSVNNRNLRGGETQGTFQDCSLTISAVDTKYTAGDNINITNNVISAENVIKIDSVNNAGFRIEDGGSYIDTNYGMIDMGYVNDENGNQTFNTTLMPGEGISSEIYIEGAGGNTYERSQVNMTNTSISAIFEYDNGGGDADTLQEDYAFFGSPIGTDENKIAKLGDIKNVMSSGTTAPSNPTEGQLWYDTTNDALKVYDGTNWNEVGGGGEGNVKFFANTTAGLQEMHDWLYNSTGRYGIVQFSSYKHFIFGPTTTTNGRVYNVEGYKTTGLSFNNGSLVRDRQNVYYNISNGVVTGGLGGVSSGSMIASGIATQGYVDARITSSSTAPSNPTEGQLWYDTTNDVLKSYDGTNWNEVGSDAADINTKTFYLSDTSDLTNAQAAYDWYVAGKNSIIIYNNDTYLFYSDNQTDSIDFRNVKTGSNAQPSYTQVSVNFLSFTYNNGTITVITPTTLYSGNISFLSPNTNYSTPYTPQYNGSPATKKYVDDSVASSKSSGATAPSNPIEGQLWYDTTNDVLKVYDGTQWNVIGDGVQLAPNSPLTPKYRRYGTQAQYEALTQYYTDTPGDTVYHTI